MDQSLGVRARQPARGLQYQSHRLYRRQPRFALEQGVQRGAVDKLHGEIRQTGLAADRVHMHDMRVVHCSNRACFALKAFDDGPIVGERPGQHLDRDAAIQRRIAGLVHHAHAAATEFRDQLVLAKCGFHGIVPTRVRAVARSMVTQPGARVRSRAWVARASPLQSAIPSSIKPCPARARGSPVMEKSFDPKTIESKWYARWEDAGVFKPHGDGDPYCILLPPPNVTGNLHMGHAFQQTLMDILIRYHRMRGECVLWQGGTDHAGIATQKIVENQLAAEGKTRHDLGRDAFIKRVWQWKNESGSVITRQMRRLGASIDWSRERFTMDAGLSAAVRRVFIDWYRAGLLYRGKRLVHWDPVLRTAVSDLEVNNEERDGHLWLIRYPEAAGGEGLVVATTRPETMLGDVAVAVHPQDERYKQLIGKKLKLPLSEREIPVIGDEYVDREFGTGAVKITPGHDFNDYRIGQRHRLPVLTIFTLDAKVSDSAPPAYYGLDRFAARKRIIADLTQQRLLVETRKHKLTVPISQRSDAIIEPMLTDQWFLDLTSDTRVDGKPGPGGRRPSRNQH